MKKIYVVTDLGPGDGGKGGVVHKISHMQRAHTILKVGGAQGSHGVHTSKGEKHAFSQFGCGTFEGVRTYLTPRFIASPEGILNEAATLRYEHGIYDIFDLLTVDEEVICATHYHGIASKIKELSRKDNPRGTIGTGVGEAYRYSQQYEDLTIRAKDLSNPNLRDRLAAIRDQVITDINPLLSKGFLEEDQAVVDHELDRLHDPEFLEFIVGRFKETARAVKVVDRDYLRNNILARDGVAVVESSHGILTDRYQGFNPHTSAIRTLPRFTTEMLLDAGYDGKIVNIGVTRGYQIRHGAGPMPTADESMTEQLLPGSHKQNNRYQGEIRVGPLDLVLLRYAIAASGGPSTYDALAISWFDQIQKNGSWKVCDRYENFGELPVRFGTDSAQLSAQEKLCEMLYNCTPEITEYLIASMNDSELYNLCAEVLKEKLGVEVRMVSFGKTEQDKICR